MPDQNNAPERIWIKPCDPCENPYDYYVCDPRYLDGRETSYVKSVVSCAGCGGGLKRQSGQFVCRDCGKAETVQEVLARADRAAPEGQPVTLTYTNWRGETAERTITPKRVWFGSTDWHPEPQWLLTAFDAEKQADRDFALKDFGHPALAAPTDNPDIARLWVETANSDEFCKKLGVTPVRDTSTGDAVMWRDNEGDYSNFAHVIEAAVAPTDNTALVTAAFDAWGDPDAVAWLKAWNLGAQTGPHWVHLGAAPPPACQQEAVTERALLQRAVDLINGDLTGSEWKRACRAFVKDAHRVLKEDQK